MSATTRRLRELQELALARELAATGEARRLRIEARLSQSDFARACDVSDSAISRWESGERVPRGSGARTYAALLASLRD